MGSSERNTEGGVHGTPGLSSEGPLPPLCGLGELVLDSAWLLLRQVLSLLSLLARYSVLADFTVGHPRIP